MQEQGGQPGGGPQQQQQQQNSFQQFPPMQQQQQQQGMNNEEGLGAVGAGEDAEGGAGDPRNPQLRYKTRLCIRFMQTGFCSKGASCTFAHGYEDLRLPGHEMGMGMPHPHQMMMMMPPPLQGGVGPRGTPRGGSRGGMRQPPPRASPTVDRARAMSAVAGVGEAAATVPDGAVDAAAGAVRNGDAFRGSAYADSAEDFALAAST
jgi:hypothetical protein